MRCRKAKRLLWSGIEGEPAPLPAELEDHLAACPSCAHLAREIRDTWRLLGGFRGIEPRADYKARFRARLRSAAPLTRPQSAAWPAWRWLALAAASVAIVVVVAGRLLMPPAPVELGVEPADRWDETFLEELERTLRNAESDYLREYDSWPAGYLEGTEAEPRGLPAGKGQPSRGGYRHDDV